MNERVIYFAFDSSEVDDASIEIIKQHARYLAENPGETRAPGRAHADERGTREYNIGLGERRAVSRKDHSCWCRAPLEESAGAGQLR